MDTLGTTTSRRDFLKTGTAALAAAALPAASSIWTARSYAAIPGAIEAWLADRELAPTIGRNNGAYYDRFVDPQSVGEQIVAAAERHASGA